MKFFKQYIIESDKKKELFHSFFVSKAGKIIEPTSSPLNGTKVDIDHVYIPLNQPHDFDMTDRQMDDVLDLSDLEKLEVYKTGKGPLDASVDRRLSSRGFIRAINSGWGNSSTRRITLAATTTGTHDRHHLDDLTPAIKAIRERLPDHRDWRMKIYGLKYHEPHELEAMRHRLSPVHVKQLTDGSELDLMNTDEIDRFIHGHGSLSRDPGSGVHDVPSPEEAMRKAGTTDEPKSIQRGRFFQSDSYDPINIEGEDKMTLKEYYKNILSENMEEKKSFQDDIIAAVRQHVKDPHITISSAHGDNFDIMDHARSAAENIEWDMKNPDKLQGIQKDKHTRRIEWLKRTLPPDVVDTLMKKHFER